MNQLHHSNTLYQVGGSLSEDAPSYVRREADNQLYQYLRTGEFCCVFNSRQMGKSSLRVKTMKRLEEAGIACAAIDITAIGTQNITVEQWYGSLIRTLASSFNLEQQFDRRSWMKKRSDLSPVQCFGEFIEEVLLKEITSSIIIFIDEVDSVLRLDFKDDFFALIRALYNKKADTNSACKRINFVLLGVATPSALIQDKNRTPLNMGKLVELKGFQLDETAPLEVGIQEKVEDAKSVLREILVWTGGQPFLTQKICKLIEDQESYISAGEENEKVKSIVQDYIIENWEIQDEPEHLKTIQNRILYDNRWANKLLEIYQEILRNKEINADDSHALIYLQLSGLVVKKQNKLRISNQIYQTVFDQTWMKNKLASLRPNYYAKKLSPWLASNCLDVSYLLNKEELQNAQEWAADKSLTNQDYQFLNASLDYWRKKSEQEAEQILVDAKKKAKRQGILAALIMFLATATGVWATYQIVSLRDSQDAELEKRISTGEDIFLNPNLDKRAGAQLFRNGDFENAARKFRKSLKNIHNDPEARIYLNNAKFASSNPLLIAVGVPIGKNKDVAQEMLRGVAQAQNEVNKSCQIEKIKSDCGINGRPLQVKIVNDYNDPEIAIKLANQLVKDKDVLAVVGHNASDVSRAVVNVYQGHLVMISPTSTSMDFHPIRESQENYIFRTPPSIRVMVQYLAEQIIKIVKDPEILVCYDSDTDDNNSFVEEFEKFETEGIKLVDLECDFSDPNLNYDEIINQAIKQKANSLILAPHVDRINEAIRIAKVNHKQQSDEQLQLFSSPSLYTFKTLEDEEGRNAVKGMQLAVAWHPDIVSEHSFSRNARELWGEEDLNYTVATWRTAMSYDATQVIIKGLKENPTRKSLQKVLSKENFFIHGATGKVEFEDGERQQKKAFLVEIKKVTESNTDLDFVPIPTE